jgi:hypothetical protein
MDTSLAPKRKWLVAVAAAAVLVLALIAYLWYGAGGHFILQTIDYAVQNLANRSGLSVFLVRGLAIIVTIPFFWAVGKFTYGFFWPGALRPSLRFYRSTHGMIIVAYVGLYFVAMAYASRNAFHYKYCARTPEGIRTSDSPGVDRIYGVQFEPCTVEDIEEIRKAQPKRLTIENPQDFAFFDSVTGEPRVWYYKWPDGTYQFFDRPGKHPGTGADLIPIDRKTVDELIGSYVKHRFPGIGSAESYAGLACGLGSRWIEQEDGFSSVWVRRGVSNIYDVTFANGTRTVNIVTVSNGKVYVERTQSTDGNNCTYEGTVSPDGRTIRGTYHSSNGRVPGLYNWIATIDCNSAPNH